MKVQVTFKTSSGEEAIVKRLLFKKEVGSIFFVKLRFWDDNISKYKKYRVPVQMKRIHQNIGVAVSVKLGD